VAGASPEFFPPIDRLEKSSDVEDAFKELKSVQEMNLEELNSDLLDWIEIKPPTVASAIIMQVDKDMNLRKIVSLRIAD
jgi:hypothetical protein